MVEENNKRVAKNTVFLYFRMILIMFVTLYTSRVILEQLGIKDYGIYSVVGGVVSLFAFLNSCMTTSTQRFMTFELGRGDHESLKRVFAASLNIHLCIAIFVVMLAETFGVWLVNEKLVIPVERIWAANWVFQFSILGFCVNIIQVPYNAVLIAHEKMNVYAYISILEVILKLGVVYLLSASPFDKLISYAALLFGVQCIIRIIYQLYCIRYYRESHFCLFWDKVLYSKLSGFAGWNLIGSIAWLLRSQGVDIVLNLFFGPVINAARGVAAQVSGAVMNFISNFQVALNPQITKNYANGNLREMEQLVYLGLRLSYIILFILAFPLILNIEYILQLWLVDVPAFSGEFVILILIDCLVGTILGGPLMTSISATGDIRNYQIVVNSIILCVVPIGYILLRMGCGASSIFYVMIAISLVSGFSRFLFCRKQIGFSFHRLSSQVLIPIFWMTLISIPFPLYMKIVAAKHNGFGTFIYLSLLAFFVSSMSAWFLGIRKKERNKLCSILKIKMKEYI